MTTGQIVLLAVAFGVLVLFALLVTLVHELTRQPTDQELADEAQGRLTFAKDKKALIYDAWQTVRAYEFMLEVSKREDTDFDCLFDIEEYLWSNHKEYVRAYAILYVIGERT